MGAARVATTAHAGRRPYRSPLTPEVVLSDPFSDYGRYIVAMNQPVFAALVKKTLPERLVSCPLPCLSVAARARGWGQPLVLRSLPVLPGHRRAAVTGLQARLPDRRPVQRAARHAPR